jgi:hypothetical protein
MTELPDWPFALGYSQFVRKFREQKKAKTCDFVYKQNKCKEFSILILIIILYFYSYLLLLKLKLLETAIKYLILDFYLSLSLLAY